jgi:hypothetical protein
MANWSGLRVLLADVDDTMTIGWADLDALVGGLPRSAYDHPAFWKGDRSGWPGFTTADVRVGRSVTFVRRTGVVAKTVRRPPAPSRTTRTPADVDVVLLGCVKRKLPHAAPAQDLYDSPLFRKERTYAEAAGAPWFILSAQHGLVAPTEVLHPYELRLSKTSREYRRTWGQRVVDQLADQYGDVAGRVVEIHAGAAYADAIRERLRSAGAVVEEPLRGLTMGQRLAWYSTDTARAWAPASHQAGDDPDLERIVDELNAEDRALTPTAFLATRGDGLRRPGLYSWWVDGPGATDLSRGLAQPLSPGLIYAGLAGATRSRSRQKSTNTLWGRIRGMHLGGRHQFSTFRLSLGSVLAHATGAAEIDEARLTDWMHEHLRVVTVVVDDADALDGLETAVLAALEPPLNLAKMPKTPIRLQLSALRRQYGTRT